MTKTTAEKRRAERQLAAAVATELAALGALTTAELAAKWEALSGEKARTHNGANLRKRLAWRIQELALGGLSETALAKIDELAPPAAKLTIPSNPAAKGRGGPKPIVGRPARDPRLPDPGTILVRVYDGVRHEVTVLDQGFQYRDQRYGSLSKIAREITGTAWNGFAWMGLSERKRAAAKQEAA